MQSLSVQNGKEVSMSSNSPSREELFDLLSSMALSKDEKLRAMQKGYEEWRKLHPHVDADMSQESILSFQVSQLKQALKGHSADAKTE